MNNLERYLDQVIEQRPEIQELPPEEPAQEASPNFLRSIRRRWYIVLAVTILVCGIGLPAVWFLVKPLYVVQGAMQFAQGLDNPMTGREEGTGTPYGLEVGRLILDMTQGNMLSAIAEEFEDHKDLEFFSGEPQTLIGKVKAKFFPRDSVFDPKETLRNAMTSDIITVARARESDFVTVEMKSQNLREAEFIVNTIISTLRTSYARAVEGQEGKELQDLKDEKDKLVKDIAIQRETIRDKILQVGTPALDPYQEMELQVETELRKRLIGLKAETIRAEANVELLKQDVNSVGDVNLPEIQVMAMEQDYVNNDPMIQQLKTNVLEMERNLIISRRTLQPENPTLKQQEGLLADFRAAVDDRTKDLSKEFRLGLEERQKAAAQQRLDRGEAELRSMKAQARELEKELEGQSKKTTTLGQRSLDIQELQFKLAVDMDYLDQISRRIKQVEMEESKSTRVQTTYPAQYIEMEDRRVKLAVTVVFGALAAGGALAFLRDKMDKTLQTPDDVTRYLGLPLLGTTTSSRAVKATRFAEQIAGDYQTIRANLGLLSNEGIPRKLAVGSPGTREGKTTFAVNLATSLAKSGKRVLLIDGDLRKPDVGNMLSIPNGNSGLQDVLLGEDPNKAIYSVPESGLHVLAAGARRMTDVYELLASSTAAQQMDRLGREYDHIIVDTPPALAFPDALVWAKLTDAVILVGFAGQTTAPDLKEAKERFKRARVHVIGAILSNVSTEHGLYRYGYGYRAGEAPVYRGSRQKKLMLPAQSRDADA